MGHLSMLLLSLSALPDAGIPFEVDDERLYVQVRGPTGPEIWFILDTGAQPTIVDENVAKAWSLSPGSTEKTWGAGRGTLQQGVLEGGLHLELSGMAFDPRSVRVAPLEKALGPTSGHAVGGIIGSEFFAGRQVRLDFLRHELTFAPTGREAAGTRVPIELRGSLPHVRGVLTRLDGREVPIDLLLDLGAKFNLLLGETFLGKVGVGAPPRSAFIASLGAGVGGRTRYRFVPLPGLRLADAPSLSWSDLPTGLSVEGSLRLPELDGLLGLSVLRGYRLTIDETAGAVWFEPASPTPWPGVSADRSGVFLTRATPAGPVVVDEVRAPSPASVAGLRVGDVLERVDGVEVGALSLGAVRDRLRRPGEVSVAWARASQHLSATLRLTPKD